MLAKICGLSQKDEVEVAISYGAAFCGFILNWPKSHRHIDISKITEFSKIPKKKSKFVGVLVNPTDEEITKFNHPCLDYFQLHGEETVDRIKEIKLLSPKKIIKTIKINSEKDLALYNDYEKIVDIFLFDSKSYELSRGFDHSLLKNIDKRSNKWMIAGNIKIEDLENITKIADYVDVSGSLETNKKKDKKKIKDFLIKAQEINNENKKRQTSNRPT